MRVDINVVPEIWENENNKQQKYTERNQAAMKHDVLYNFNWFIQKCHFTKFGKIFERIKIKLIIIVQTARVRF
jgi:hypothetical protein